MKKYLKIKSMKSLIIISFLLSFFLISSQELATQSSVGTVTSMNDLFTKHLKASGNEEVLGSPFLFSNWENTGVIYSEGNKHSLKKLNYNILSDEVGSLKGKDSVLTYDKVKIDSFLIGKKTFKKYYKSFYEVLYNGAKISLLRKYEVNIIEGMFNPIDGTKEKSRFKTIDDFYIKKGEDIVKYIPSKKTISSVFDEHRDLVKKFIKENKLSLKKEKDLIQIFEYYNQL